MEMTNLMFCVKNGSEFAQRKKLMTIRNHFGSFVEIKSPWKTDYHQFNLRENPISFNLCSGIVFVGKYYLCLRTLFQHAIIIFNSIYVKSKIDFVICQVCWWGQKCGENWLIEVISKGFEKFCSLVFLLPQLDTYLEFAFTCWWLKVLQIHWAQNESTNKRFRIFLLFT